MYLPKKFAKFIEKKYLRASSTDAIVEFLINGGDPYSLDWSDIPFSVANGFTTEGESAVTAVIKADFKEGTGMHSRSGIVECLQEAGGVNIMLQNQHGESPLQLAMDLHQTNSYLISLISQKTKTVSI